MRELTMDQMQAIDGEGFWGGVACGLGLAAALVYWSTPIGRVGAIALGGTIIGCGSIW